MGTDTFPTDFFENIRMGSAMSRNADGESADSGYRAFFEAATLAGARALGRDDIGRLAPGCKADFIAIRLDEPNLGVIDDPLRTVCMCATGRNVTHSVINGRTVMHDGAIPGIDMQKLTSRAQEYYRRLRAGFIERSPLGESHGDGSLSAETFYQTIYPIIT